MVLASVGWVLEMALNDWCFSWWLFKTDNHGFLKTRNLFQYVIVFLREYKNWFWYITAVVAKSLRSNQTTFNKIGNCSFFVSYSMKTACSLRGSERTGTGRPLWFWETEQNWNQRFFDFDFSLKHYNQMFFDLDFFLKNYNQRFPDA